LKLIISIKYKFPNHFNLKCRILFSPLSGVSFFGLSHGPLLQSVLVSGSFFRYELFYLLIMKFWPKSIFIHFPLIIISCISLTQPLEACFSFLKSITTFLEKLITWPRDVGQAIASGSTAFPAPF
jgi:hypothetical protein